MTVPAHDRLEKRHVYSAVLRMTTALHIGAGKTSDGISPSDMPLMRNGAGEPFIPGSSFRGALRSSLEALLRGLGVEPPVCDLFRKVPSETKDSAEIHRETGCSHRIAWLRQKEKLRRQLTEDRAFEIAVAESCPICSLFGHSFLASRIWIPDLPLSAPAPTYTRDGVGIDRDLRSASPSALYNFEALPAGTSFSLRLDLENGEDHELGLLLAGFDLFAQGLASLGGKRARGLGALEVESLTVTFWTAEDFFRGTKEKELGDTELERLRAAARDHYLEKGAS